MEKHFNQFLSDLQKGRTFNSQGLSYDAIAEIVIGCAYVTTQQACAITGAFNHFNECLFNDSLSQVYLAFNRRFRSMGHYKPKAWRGTSAAIVPEININPSTLHLEAVEAYSTLVHEMAHHAQFLFGRPSGGGYHNEQFARLMFSVGLMCSNTGVPGGKTTGRQMTHYIVPGGPFECAFKEMPKEFLAPFKPVERERSVAVPLAVKNNPNGIVGTKTLADPNKTKYTCSCGNKVWGRPNMNVICGDCMKSFLIVQRKN